MTTKLIVESASNTRFLVKVVGQEPESDTLFLRVITGDVWILMGYGYMRATVGLKGLTAVGMRPVAEGIVIGPIEKGEEFVELIPLAGK